MGRQTHYRVMVTHRPRLPCRSLEELYRLPLDAIVTAEEASLVTRLTVSALAVRRVKKQWPPYAKFGRLVRYQMGDLLCPVGFSAKSERRTDEPEGPVEIPTSPMPSRFT